MKNVTVWKLVFEFARSGVIPEEILPKVRGKQRVTVFRWLKGIRYRGIKRFVKEKKEIKRKRKRRCLDTRMVLKIKKIRQETGWHFMGECLGVGQLWDCSYLFLAAGFRMVGIFYLIIDNWSDFAIIFGFPSKVRFFDIAL